MNEKPKRPVLLVILDGWGYREEPRDNAIANAETPVWDRLWREAPHALISGSGLDVGLPDGQMGNSEVGHMSLGLNVFSAHKATSKVEAVWQPTAACARLSIHGARSSQAARTWPPATPCARECLFSP